MAIDYAALLQATAVLKFAVVSYDFDRDFGDVGKIALAGEMLPAGSWPLFYVLEITTPIEQAGGGNNQIGYLMEGLMIILTTISVNGVGYFSNMPTTKPPVPRALEFKIVDNEITAGAFTLYLVYLPT